MGSNHKLVLRVMKQSSWNKTASLTRDSPPSSEFLRGMSQMFRVFFHMNEWMNQVLLSMKHVKHDRDPQTGKRRIPKWLWANRLECDRFLLGPGPAYSGAILVSGSLGGLYFQESKFLFGEGIRVLQANCVLVTLCQMSFNWKLLPPFEKWRFLLDHNKPLHNKWMLVRKPT